MTSNLRVPVVTGGGWVTPLGSDVPALKATLLADPTNTSLWTLPELDFKGITGVKNKRTKKMDPLSKTVSIAAYYAMEAAKLDPATVESGSGSVVSGSAFGASDSIDSFNRALITQGPQAVNPNVFPSTSHNVAGGHVSIHFGFSGPLIHFASGAISSHLAIVYAADLIACSRADIVLCGGWEQLSSEHSQWLLGEGKVPSTPMACMLVMESRECAMNRGADILAQIPPQASIIDSENSTNTAPSDSSLLKSAYGASGALSLLEKIYLSDLTETTVLSRNSDGSFISFTVEPACS